MVDPLSATSAAASFIGLAGQAAQGIAFILSVIDDFRDAPRLIINLKTKLQVLEDTLTILSKEQPVKVSPQAKKCITEAVEQCWSQIDSLRKLIERNDSSSIEGATKRRWKQFLAGSNKAHFQKHVSELETAKTSLDLAIKVYQLALSGFQGDILEYIRDSQGEHADHVRKSLSKIHTSLSIYSETTENTLAATSRIEGGVTEIKEGLETVHQSIEGLTSTVCTTIQSELDRQMNNFLLSFLSPSELKALLPHQQAQTGCISRGLQLRLSDSGQELNNGKAIVLQGQKHITSSTDYQNSSQGWTSSSSEGIDGTELSPRRKPQTIYSPTTRKTETSSYRIPTVAGILQATTTVTQITCTISSRRNAEEKSFTECRRTLTFFPFSCFRLKAFRASYESVPNLNDCNVSRSLNFRYFHTVPFDSLGFRRAIKGDWKGLRQLIEAEEITPLDVDPNGRGLLDYSSDFDSDITDENLEMIQYLIDLGADSSGLMPKVLQQCQSNSSDYMCGKSEISTPNDNLIHSFIAICLSL